MMIRKVYPDGDRVKIIVIPDIESVNIGRKVGYDVNRYDAPENIEGISATEIRDLMSKGNHKWKEFVPGAMHLLLKNLEDVRGNKNAI